MKVTGPNHWTLPPLEQRRRQSEQTPLVPTEQPIPHWVRMAWWAFFLILCVAIWAMFFGAAFS